MRSVRSEVRVLGVDWATEAKRRAAVEVRSGQRGLALVSLERPYDDQAAAQALREEGLAVVAVDTPFGWPAPFVEFVSGWSVAAGGPPPPSSKAYALRRTDVVVKEETGKQPLSVSSDRIALCALSWVKVVAAERAAARVDVGQRPARPVIEVYPGASLKLFSKDSALKLEGYKKSASVRRKVLQGIFAMFEVGDPKGLLESLVGERDDDSDGADAFLAALTGVAYLDRLPGWTVRRPSEEEQALAAREGWMFFPVKRA